MTNLCPRKNATANWEMANEHAPWRGNAGRPTSSTALRSSPNPVTSPLQPPPHTNPPRRNLRQRPNGATDARTPDHLGPANDAQTVPAAPPAGQAEQPDDPDTPDADETVWLPQRIPNPTQISNLASSSNPDPSQTPPPSQEDPSTGTHAPRATNESMYYIGAAEDFKARYRNHLKSFKNQKYEKETELSKYIWYLKKRNIDYTIKWKILKKTKGYNPVAKSCSLCLSEKVEMCNFLHKNNLMNKRNELISKCRHENKFLLANQ